LLREPVLQQFGAGPQSKGRVRPVGYQGNCSDQIAV
jgi:hypothetical protein